jgi:hypothetical protein
VLALDAAYVQYSEAFEPQERLDLILNLCASFVFANEVKG